MADRFLFLPEIASDFGKSVATLREVAEAQHGVFSKPRVSLQCQATYPRFTKGPGGKWGLFASQLAAYWLSLKDKHENVVEFAKFARGR